MLWQFAFKSLFSCFSNWGPIPGCPSVCSPCPTLYTSNDKKFVCLFVCLFPSEVLLVTYLTMLAFFCMSHSCNCLHLHHYKTVLTYSMEQSSSEKLTVFQPVKKFPAFYGTRRFITAFTSVRHLSLSLAS